MALTASEKFDFETLEQACQAAENEGLLRDQGALARIKATYEHMREGKPTRPAPDERN